MSAKRLKDKIAASKRKGFWKGKSVRLGSEPEEKSLLVNAKVMSSKR